MSNRLKNGILLSTIVISLLMHLPHFKKDLVSIHVWRQTQTQSTINSFYQEDMNIFHPKRLERKNTNGNFRMEFPLMQWSVAVFYKAFGNHLVITRICMFIIGIFSVLGIYQLLLMLFRNPLLAVIGAWAFNFSPAFYYYTINPLPDNLSLAAAIWGMALFFRWTHHENRFSLLLSGLLFTIATLCKLPFILFFAVPGIWFLRELFRTGWSKKLFFDGIVAFFSLIFPLWWYLTVIPEWGENMVIKGMLNNGDSANQLFDYLQHNLVSTLPELLLNYGSVIFFLAGFYFLFRNKAWKNRSFLPLATAGLLIICYYLFEANAIAKIHDYYLFPFMPLLFVLVAYGAFQLYNTGKKWRYAVLVILLVLPVTCFLRMQTRWDEKSPGFNPDLLAYRNELRTAVPANDLVVAGNDDSHFIFLYYIDKKGWGFDHDSLTGPELAEMIRSGAKYLYTDADAIIANPLINNHFEKLVLQKGTIRVYKLK